jgi:hypothetical protein
MKPLLLLFFTLLLSGCLSSNDPFYTESSIVTDDRLIGTFEKDGIWSIKKHPSIPKHYSILLRERKEWIELDGTLFTIDSETYLDLKKEKENPSTAGDPAGSSQVQFLSKLLKNDTHTVLGISIEDDSITLKGSDIHALRAFRDSFRPHQGRMIVNEEHLTITTGTEESRMIVSEAQQQHGLFHKPITFKRK